MNKGHCITICLLYLILSLNLVDQRVDAINNYYLTLELLSELNERLNLEVKVINDIKKWLLVYEEDEEYWPFSEYAHYKDMNYIEYIHHEFTMRVYYQNNLIYDYELVDVHKIEK